MSKKVNIRVIIGGLFGVVIGYLTQELVGFVSPQFKPMYVALLAVTAGVCIVYLSGAFQETRNAWWIWRRPRIPVRLAILCGHEHPHRKTKRCGAAYSSYSSKRWKDRLETYRIDKKRLFKVQMIHSSHISNRHAIVINPFGEVFPESDLKEYSDFSRVVEYLKSGGIFANAGGYPFFYNWNYAMDRTIDTTPRTTSIVVDRGNLGVVSLELFTDSLASREFGLMAMNGSRKPKPREVFQSDDDQRLFGDLVEVGGKNEVKEFRALEKETTNLLPILRARDGDREIYPLAAIQVGQGLLLVAGMDVDSDSEFSKIAEAVRNLASGRTGWRAGD